MAPRNRTLRLEDDEIERLMRDVVSTLSGTAPMDRVICADMEQACTAIAPESVDLLLLDPPYHLRKKYSESVFAAQSALAYQEQFARWLGVTLPTLKPSATVYICAEWRTSALITPIIADHLTIRNRITWEREKGRGAKSNWKNISEDIWFCTYDKGDKGGDEFKFYADRVKLRRPVFAPYRDHAAQPKDWQETAQGGYRDTAPSNLWTDVTVPFWSMSENTDHPTQKPEKLLARLILASSDEGDVILDPFLGSGTSAVVAKKLGRQWIGIERERAYCALAQKRLANCAAGDAIQGYSNGVFWPRNSLNHQKNATTPSRCKEKV